MSSAGRLVASVLTATTVARATTETDMGISECGHGTILADPMDICSACFLEEILKLTRSRDGSPEQDEKLLAVIGQLCEEQLKTLNIDTTEIRE